MAVLGSVLVAAGIKDPADLGDMKGISEERRKRALKVLAGRTVDLKVVTENESAMVQHEAVSEILKACYATPRIDIAHIEPFLEKHGSMVFPCERVDTPENRRLLTIRVQRAVAGVLPAAVPVTQTKRFRRAHRKKGTEVTSAEEFEAVVMELVQLGEVEKNRRAQERIEAASKRAKVTFGGNMTGAETSGSERSGAGGFGGAMTGADSGSGSGQEPDIIDGPSMDVWSKWSAGDLVKYVLSQNTSLWTGLGTGVTVKLITDWRMDGKTLASVTQNGWSADLDLGISDSLVTDIAVPILRKLVMVEGSGSRGVEFGKGTKEHDGTGGGSDVCDKKFGRVNRGVTGNDILRYPSKRTAWHGQPVMWLEKSSEAFADDGAGDPSALVLERFGVLTTSKNVNGSGPKFLRQAAIRDIEDSWIDVSQAASALAAMQQYVDTPQGHGKEVDMVGLLSDVSDQEASWKQNRGPKGERKKHETKELKEVLEECAARGAISGAGDHPTSFTDAGIQSGTDMRTYLCAVNLGGKSLSNVAEHEAERECLRLTRKKLLRFDCAPTDRQIIEIQNFSGSMTNLACLNPVKKETGMLSASTKGTKTVIVQRNGEMEVDEVEVDGRKQKSIVTQAMAKFALRRCADIWATKHGQKYGDARYLEFLKMFDDVMQGSFSSDSVKPIAEIITAAWQHMGGALMQATREVKGIHQHAGFELSLVSAIPAEWASDIRSEIIMDCRLEWIDMRCSQSKADGGKGPGRGRRGRLGDDEGPPRDTGDQQQKASQVEAEALQKHGFKDMKSAKRDFLKDEGNRNKCWWACSSVGKELGGCPFNDCKFESSHPDGEGSKKRKAKRKGN
jgi:hypothetical protein